MSKSTKSLRNVPAAVVREFHREGKFTVEGKALACLTGGPQGRGRGRLHPEAVAAFNEVAAKEGMVYSEAEGKALAGRQVTLPLTKMNARGARLNRPEQFPISEVRALAGAEGRKGRLSKADISTATSAVEAQRGWDKPATPSKGKGRKAQA